MRLLTFEEYLRNQFGKQYNGFYDEAPDAENDWLAELEPQDWLDYAEAWVKERENSITNQEWK